MKPLYSKEFQKAFRVYQKALIKEGMSSPAVNGTTAGYTIKTEVYKSKGQKVGKTHAETARKALGLCHEALTGEPSKANYEPLANVVKGYEPLADVLQEALDQAQRGKGAKCHANGLPFLEQPIMVEGRSVGAGFLAGQVRKKVLEAKNCEDDDRAIEDLLGAINYVGALILLRREKTALDHLPRMG